MVQKIIGLGVPDKGNGDPLRTAFSKVNDNFAELYNSVSAVVVVGATAPINPSVGDLWWNSESGRMYVYYGTSWVDASPVDGAGISSTNELVNGAYSVVLESTGALRANVQAIISDNQLAIEGNGLLQMQTLDGPYISIFNETGAQEINLVAYNGIDTYPTWTFDTRGTLTVPSLFPRTFTATVDSAHYYGEGSLTLLGSAWSFAVTFAIGANGAVETQISNSTPWSSNPGYTNGIAFRFVEADHGIPGYTFTLTLVDIQNPGPMMHTTNLTASTAPTLPATITSSETVKITADATSWLFTPNGDLRVPGVIKQGNNQLDLNYGDGFVNLTSTTDDSTSLYLSSDNAALTGRLTASVTAGVAGEAARTTYTEKTNELALAFLAESWTGAGYPAGINSSQQLNAAKALNPLIPDAWITIASELKTAWDAWQEVLEFSDFSIAVGGNDVVWQFEPQGTLTTPGDIQLGANSYLRFPDSSFQGTAFVGDASRLYGNVDEDVEVTVRHRPAVSAQHWRSGGVNNFVADTTDNDDITVVQEGWTVDIDGTVYTVTAIIDGINEFEIYATDATFVVGTTYTFTNPTATLQTWTFNQQTATLIAPGGAILSSETAPILGGDTYRDFSIDLPTPDGTNEYRWTFGNTAGALTFPDGTTTTGESITLPVDQSLTVNTSYSMGPGGATTFKINPESIKLPTGNGVIFSGTETAAHAWWLDSTNKSLSFPDAGDGVLPQINYSNADTVTGMELITYAKTIKITAAQANSWTFGTDGELTVPSVPWDYAPTTFTSIPTTYGAAQLTFTVLPDNTFTNMSVAVGGGGYGADNQQLTVPGTTFPDGASPANDIVFNVTTFPVPDFPSEITTASIVTYVSGNPPQRYDNIESSGSVGIGANNSHWTFGTDGALTLPDASVIASYKPVTVIAATTTAQTITDNASAAFIQFVDTVDTASAYSTGTFTAPYTGYYQINMSVYFSTTVTLGSGSFLLIDTNLDFTKQVRIIDGGWTGSYLHYSTVISATAGDAIRIAFRQVSGGDIDVSSGSRLTIHRVSIS